ncbi:MAG: glycosyltransferase [Baekduia sp.]
MTPRVWHVTDSGVFSGAERQIAVLLKLTDRSRWRPVLVHTGVPGIEPLVAEARACGAETLMMRHAGGPRGALALARLIRSGRPDLVNAHLNWPLAMRWPVAGAIAARRPAIVATVHSSAQVEPHRLVEWQQRRCAPLVTRYVAVSEAVARHCIDRNGWPAGQVSVIRNGVEPERCTGGDAARGRELLGVPGERPIVLMLARLEQAKGIDVLVDAARKVPDAVFVVAGDGPYRGEAERLIAEAAIGARFHLPGRVDALADVLAAAEVAVLPSRVEGLPVFLLEAMAAGVPVVGSSIPAIAELVEDGRTGLLVPVDDAAALSAALARALSDEPLRQRVSAAAAAEVTARYTAQTMVDDTLDLYDEALGRRP